MSDSHASPKSSSQKHHGSLGRVPTAILGIVVMFLLAMAVNFIAKAVGGRWDLTENNLYTLSDGTRNILKRLDTPVTVRYYANDNSDYMSPAELAYSKRVEDLLREYQKAAGSQLTIQKLNPEPSTDAEDSAILDGLQRGLSRETGNEIYLGLAVTCVDETETIPFLPARSETLLEYDLSRAIARVHDGAGSTVRIMTSMQVGGGFSGNPMMGGGATQPWFFVEDLRRDFTVEFLPATAEEIPADTETLVVLHPYDVTEQAQFAIDQYLLKGGKVVVAVDPSFFYARAMGGGGNPMQPSPGPMPNSNLNRLFEAWGVTYDDTKVVADLKYGTEIIRQGYFVPTFLTLNQDAMASDDPIVKFIQNAQFLTPGAFTITAPEGISKTDLVTTSSQTQLVGSFEADPTQEDAIQRLRDEFKSSDTTYSIISRLTGTFKTAFPDGNPADAAKEGEDADKPADPAAGEEAKKEGDDAQKSGEEAKKEEPAKPASLKASEKEGVVLLISDVDFLYDAVCVRLNQIPGLNMSIPEPLNGNLSLVQNAIDQLSGDPELINVRSRSSSRRPFTKLNEWLSQAEAKFRGELSDFETKAKEAETRINDILKQTPGNVEDALLSPEVQSQLEELRKEQVSMNKKVRELNKEMKRDFDLVQNLIKLLTTGLMPILVIVVGVALAVARRLRTAAR